MSRELKTVLDEANPNKVPNAQQILRAGRAFGLVARTISGTVTSHILTLPDDAKAVALLKGFARAGTVTGYKEPVADDATLAAGEMQVNAAGDVLFLAADAVTEAEVTYLVQEGEVIEETLPVASDLATLTPSTRRAVILIEVSASTGTSGGAKTPAARGSTPGAGFAAITTDGTQIEFAAADAISEATVKYVAFPGTAGDTSHNDAIESSVAL